MAESRKPGEVLWIDLTVPEASKVRDFAVVRDPAGAVAALFESV